MHHFHILYSWISVLDRIQVELVKPRLREALSVENFALSKEPGEVNHTYTRILRHRLQMDVNILDHLKLIVNNSTDFLVFFLFHLNFEDLPLIKVVLEAFDFGTS